MYLIYTAKNRIQNFFVLHVTFDKIKTPVYCGVESENPGSKQARSYSAIDIRILSNTRVKKCQTLIAHYFGMRSWRIAYAQPIL